MCCSCLSLESAVHTPFVLSQLSAQFAVFSPRIVEKGNYNILAHYSFV